MPLPSKKFYATTQKTERLGVNFVERIILEMGFAWNELHVEFGVDGQIEIVNTADDSATNRIVMVQVKGVLQKFQSESDTHLSYSCEKAHIDYWLGGTAPIILVACRPSTNEAYWKDLKSYFRDPANHNTQTVRFNKQTDIFDKSLAGVIANLASPEGGHYLGNLPRKETLISNLFPVSPTFDTVWVGVAKAADRKKFFEKLCTLGVPWVREIILEGDLVYSLHDLNQQPLTHLVEPGTVETQDREFLSKTDVPQLHKVFLQLLYRALEQLCFHKKVLKNHSSKRDIYFCQKEESGRPRQMKCQSLQNVGTRTLVDYHESRLEGKSGYFKHSAFEGKFLRIEDDWFLEVTPTHYFSSDGVKEHYNSQKFLKGAKEMERHRSVVGDILMWKALFSNQELGLGKNYNLLRLNAPEEFEIETGIDDQLWNRTGDPIEQEDFTEDDEGPKTQEEMTLW